uniref:LOW QUALITY PROTEIN: protein FAM53C n=1 Tax=Gasterosteus aculeatus aculeatus TaxID=481459 RepID=UPI001A989788|nr:LOW QUALITY PROTEIN: protein FAM53C [Gasterosteus aculeatus aculeatus]
MPESSYWQLCPPSKSGLQGGLLSSSFPPGPVPLVPPDAHLQEGGDPLDTPPSHPPLQQHRPLAPSSSASELSLPGAPAVPPGGPGLPPPPPPPPKRHCRSLSVPEDLSRCRYTWRPSASRVWTPVSRQQCHGAVGGGVTGAGGVGVVGGGACPLRAPSSSLNSSLHSSSSPTFFSLALSPDSPLPWSFPWDPSEAAAAGGGACCCFFPSPSSCSSSPSPLHPPPPPQRRFSLSPVLIRDSAASTFLPPPPAAPSQTRPRPPSCSATAAGVLVPVSPSSACSTPSSLRRCLPPQLPRCHSQPCDLLLLKPGLKRRRDPDRPCARPVLDFTKMTQTRSMDPQALERGGRPPCGGDVLMDSFMGDFRSSCSPAECLGRTSIGPLSESDEECREDEEDGEEEDGEEAEAPEREAAQQAVFERDCTELDLNLIEEN